jgi:hypothetical protein
MFDSITVDTIPTSPQAVAGYVNGFWPDFERMAWTFRDALHLSIAVTAEADADCLDIEAGDAVPAQAPAWFRRQLARGVRKPVLYCGLANAATVVGVMHEAGIGRDEFRLWTAHYTERRHLCSAECGFEFQGMADATQFTEHSLGRNLDESVCSDTFFEVPVRNPHYERYWTGPFRVGRLQLNERATVQEYDRLIANPRQNKARIAILRAHIQVLRDRVYTVAHLSDPPNWHDGWRGWRWQKLHDRLTGPVKIDVEYLPAGRG